MTKLIAQLKAWDDATQGNATHKKIVDTYNSYLPHPRGYALTYSDAWCAAMVSAAAIACDLTDIIPVECSCSKQIEAYKEMGCWVEDDGYIPSVGDQMFYDWQDDGIGDNTGAPDHTGIVTAVDGDAITVIEGNKGDAHTCGYRLMKVNGKYIRGYGCPRYGEGEKTVLTYGSKGEEVKALQNFLCACGFRLDIDGSFGPQTKAAMGEYVLSYIKTLL